MAISAEVLENTFKEMGLTIQRDGNDFVHSTAGNHAPILHSVVTIDEDDSGATIITALMGTSSPEKRAEVCQLLNLVHGQSLWNVRFHLDESGRVFSSGRHLLWGKPFNAIQFGDIFFSLLITTDRLYPCLEAIERGGKTAVEAFELFFAHEATTS